jgi:DNA-binding NarL/FixJ family response regulator
MTPIRVLLADDQLMFRDGLRTLLSIQPGIQVVGEAKDGREAIAKSASLRPDVVLMDLRMPGMNGVEATQELRARQPSVRVIVLTTFDDDEDIFAALRGGAIGYLLKDAPTNKLVEAIEHASRGESFLQPSVATKQVAQLSRSPARGAAEHAKLVDLLTERERTVLQHLVRGLSNKEIGRALSITEGTVKNHMTSILEKLGVQDRTQAALKAQAAGLW